MDNLSSFMSESNQNFVIKPHAEVTDAVVIEEDTNKDKCETATELSPTGYVVVGEMCGLAVMRGAQVFSPGSDLIIKAQSDQEIFQASFAFLHLISRRVSWSPSSQMSGGNVSGDPRHSPEISVAWVKGSSMSPGTRYSGMTSQ